LATLSFPEYFTLHPTPRTILTSTSGTVEHLKVLVFVYLRSSEYLQFYVRYSTLLHLPPLRFHCAGGCWDRTQDCCDVGIDSQTLGQI
jgi:hypothetical protein